MRDDPRPWWLCHYGTIEFLVRAQTAEAAEQKVRTDTLADNASVYQVAKAAEVRHGPIRVRQATDDDKARWIETKGDKQLRRLA